MFSGNASAAMELYGSVFPEFRVERIERYGAGASGKEGTVMRADATLHSHALIFIDSPVVHAFTFTPAVSLFVDFNTHEELEAAFATLSSGGQVFMPLGDYGFSKRFGWCADRFGVSWQRNFQ
jgi:predicted 3-demethylubiquinone-9 3-methyltransferase (glyoxalase superfamily)